MIASKIYLIVNFVNHIGEKKFVSCKEILFEHALPLKKLTHIGNNDFMTLIFSNPEIMLN